MPLEPSWEAEELGTVAVAVGAAIWSGILTVRAKRTNARLLAIEEGRDQPAAPDQRRAAVVAYAQPDGPRFPDLVLENRGASTARSLKIWINGRPVEELSDRDCVRVVSDVPKSLVSRVDWRGITLLPTMQSPFLVRLEWRDDSGLAGEWEEALTMPPRGGGYR